MKVKMQDDYRTVYTLEQVEQAKAVIRAEKEDDETPKGWATYAVLEVLKGKTATFLEILKVEAHTARNCRIWNQYGDNTGDMDVWIKAVAETTEGFVKVGAYLSDIWQSGAVDYRNHMYIQIYKKI